MFMFIQLAELSNFHTHLTLRALRPPNTRIRAIPYGYGFTYLSCPNYFFEALAWLVICLMTGSVASKSRISLTSKHEALIFISPSLAGVFAVVAVGQMTLWALKKHKNYKKEFGKSYPKGRKAMIPFIL